MDEKDGDRASRYIKKNIRLMATNSPHKGMRNELHGTSLNENSSTFTYPFRLKKSHPSFTRRTTKEETHLVLVTQFKLSHNAEEIVDYLMS